MGRPEDGLREDQSQARQMTKEEARAKATAQRKAIGKILKKEARRIGMSDRDTLRLLDKTDKCNMPLRVLLGIHSGERNVTVETLLVLLAGMDIEVQLWK